MKDNFGPPLIFRFATVMAAMITMRVVSAGGQPPPADILDTVMACVVDLANEAGITPSELKEAVRVMLMDPQGALQTAQEAGEPINKVPC